MTSEELIELVENRNVPGLVKAFSGLDEEKRRSLFATAEQLLRKAEKIGSNGIAELAVMATGPLSTARKYRSASIRSINAALGRILADRKPAWLAEWIDSTNNPIAWETFQPLIWDGCLSPASSDVAMLELARGLCLENQNITQELLRRPEWLDGVYRLFNRPSYIFYYYEGELSEQGKQWLQAITDLCEKGHIDRLRLLTSNIRALLYDFKTDTLKNLIHVHEDLAPSVEERKLLMEEYLALFISPATSVVGFALDNLKVLAKAKQLDGEAYIRAFSRVAQCPAKSHAKTAIAILKTLVDQQPRIRDAATLAAADGLGHPHEDVQDVALQLIERWAEPGDFQLSEILAAHRDQVVAPIRPRIDALLAQTSGAAEKIPTATSTKTAVGQSGDSDWQRQMANREQAINRLPEKIERLLALKETWQSCRQNRLASLVAWKPLDIPILSGLEQLAPIQSLDELFNAVEHAIETVEQGNELERIVDGISRLCDQRPNDFDRRAKPLVKRIEKLSAKWANPSRGLLTSMCDRGTVRLLMAWLTGSPKVAELNSRITDYGDTWRVMLVHRLGELFGRVKKRIAAPLLATPTHRGGWIDPMVWAERWQSLEKLNIEPPIIDLIQSLLRLAPEKRKNALECVKTLKTPYREALVWALGGEANFAAAKENPKVWLAASRCRDPEISVVNETWADKLPPGPDMLQPTVYHWTACKGTPSRYNHYAREFAESQQLSSIEFNLDPPLYSDAVQLFIAKIRKSSKFRSIVWDLMLKALLEKFKLPEGFKATDELTAEMRDWIEQQVALIDPRETPPDPLLMTTLSHKTGGNAIAKWLNPLGASLWPVKLDGYWASAVKDYVNNLEKKSSSPYSALLEPLFEQDQPVSELAALALLTASQCKNADIQTTALDAWIALIADGRADARLLGQVLARLSADGWLRLNRLTAVLREASRVSPLHAWTIAEILQDLVFAYAELPADAHHVLQLLRELLVQLGLPVRSELRPKLESSTGTGKTAKLAKQLAALEETENQERHAALLQLLDARIQRAERWNRV